MLKEAIRAASLIAFVTSKVAAQTPSCPLRFSSSGAYGTSSDEEVTAFAELMKQFASIPNLDHPAYLSCWVKTAQTQAINPCKDLDLNFVGDPNYFGYPFSAAIKLYLDGDEYSPGQKQWKDIAYYPRRPEHIGGAIYDGQPGGGPLVIPDSLVRCGPRASAAVRKDSNTPAGINTLKLTCPNNDSFELG